jgi:hypothetical protein
MHALVKPPEERKDSVKELLPLLEGLSFIQNADLELSDHLELCKCIKFDKIDRHRRLFNADDKADKFYIVVQGKLGIYFPKQKFATVRDEDRGTGQRCVLISTKEAG